MLQIRKFKNSCVFQAILLGIGLQHKSVDTVSNEIDLPTSQVLGLFNRTIRKLKTLLNKIVADAVEEELKPSLGDQHAADKVVIQPLEGLENELVSHKPKTNYISESI